MRPASCLAALCLLSGAAFAHLPGGSGEQRYLEDRTEAVGLDFVHHCGARGELLFPEITGSGGALFDYDRDGDLDVYLVESSVAEPTAPLEGGQDRLYRNDAAPGESGFRLVDVTERALLRALDYGIGVAIGDVDRDGYDDIYVTNYGPNRLWHNRGDGTFEDWTERSGTAGREWSSSAAFFDYDGDGHLDLYVANYVDADLEHPPDCYTETSERDYCGPLAFDPTPDRLYRNRGDGTFDERSVESGIAAGRAAGLGVLELDVNGDRLLDVLVANDQMENHLWLNRGDGTFSEDGLWWGFAVDREGKRQASMGVAAGDWDNDGDQDVMLTHLVGESNTLYTTGRDGFEDTSRSVGMRRGSVSSTGFGVAWLDVDQDGWLDLFVVNGEVKRIESQARSGEARPFRQPDQLFLNRAGEQLELVPTEALPRAVDFETGRGLATGDLDGDGTVDLLITNNHGPAWIWLGQKSTAARGRRPLTVESAEGATVRLHIEAATSTRTLLRRPTRSGSFASSSQPSARFWAQPKSGSILEIEETPHTVRLNDPPPGRNLVVRRPP